MYIGCRRGFTVLETMFAAVLLVIVMVVIVFAWVNVYERWQGQNELARMRQEMAAATRQIREDLKYTSFNTVDQMFFWEDAAGVNRAVSFPRAALDVQGRFSMSSDGRIVAAETIVYHLYDDPATGERSLRRSRLPRAATRARLIAQLNTIVSDGDAVAEGGTTETDFLTGVEDFYVEPHTEPIDFYDASTDPQRVGKVHFGWAPINYGINAFRFEIVGQNPNSRGYNIGLDRIMIEPAGAPREMEFYKDAISGNVSVVPGGHWSARNYLELRAGAPGATFNFVDNYDLMRESAFDHAAFSNVRRNSEANQIEVSLPLFPFSDCGHGSSCDCDSSGADNTVTGGRWHANYPTGAGSAGSVSFETDFPGFDGSGYSDPAIAIRNVISSEHIYQDADFVRIAVKSSGDHPLRLLAAFITRKDDTAAGSDMSGRNNSQPQSGQEPGDYHFHQRLFFKNAAGQLTSDGIVVDPGYRKRWSEWTAFPIDEGSDYFITLAFEWSNEDAWTGARFENALSPGELYSCLQHGESGDMITEAGSPVGGWPGAESGSTSPNVWIVAEMQTASREGYVESVPFDTSVRDPRYEHVTWTETRPGNSDISVHWRTGPGEDTSDGWDSWDDSVVVTSPDSSVSLPREQFVQFRGHLDASVSWRSNGTGRSYSDYVSAQLLSHPSQFLITGRIYASDVRSPSLDDVTVRWDPQPAGGTQYFCRVTGYIARKDDYGTARLLVNGIELISSVRVHFKLSEEIRGRTVSQETSMTTRPLNTGKFQ